MDLSKEAEGVVTEVALQRSHAVRTDDCKGSTQEIIKQQLVKGLSCSAASKGTQMM